jgi:hypothetical protein
MGTTGYDLPPFLGVDRLSRIAGKNPHLVIGILARLRSVNYVGPT